MARELLNPQARQRFPAALCTGVCLAAPAFSVETAGTAGANETADQRNNND